MKLRAIVEIDVQPVTQRTGKGLDYTDTVLPMTEDEAREVIITFFQIENGNRSSINGHAVSFDLKSID